MTRALLLLFACLYVLYPILQYRPSKKRTPLHALRLPPAPSLASPVEVRRKAWLTAIQTVWVPRHSFFLEAAALGLKTLKLSTRKLIGWPGYAFLTGTTKDQEEARVKAWEIALDAQLTGGDAEISNSRLVLTLMASGTLPDNAARLMLKALHVRVLLWGMAKAGWGTLFMFEEVSARIARYYWNRAREEHKMAMNRKDAINSERLPSHLAVLVELECDEVLKPDIIQRAYNVAWNRPSTEAVTVDEGLDAVVEDFAISSPLDALAAWWSSSILTRLLIGNLSNANYTDRKDLPLLVLANKTAPPMSGTQLRALVAQAVLSDNEQGSIDATREALPQLAPLLAPTADSPITLLDTNSPVVKDVRRTLSIAEGIYLISSQANDTGGESAWLRTAFSAFQPDMPGHDLTLLSFVASFKFLILLCENKSLLSRHSVDVERYATAIRIWAGRNTGRTSGMAAKTRGAIIERCINISRILVGIAEEEIDAGYVSGSET